MRDCFGMTPEALGTIFVVLRCPLDRQEPALAPLHPDLGFWLQFEGRLIQTSEPNLDQRVTGTDWIKQSRPTERAEATSTVARDLTAHLKSLDGPMPIHNERAPRLLSAIRAVAAPDVYRVTAHAVADRPAEASAGAYSRLHTWMVRRGTVPGRGLSPENAPNPARLSGTDPCGVSPWILESGSSLDYPETVSF
jgi:hypothetical protein